MNKTHSTAWTTIPAALICRCSGGEKKPRGLRHPSELDEAPANLCDNVIEVSSAAPKLDKSRMKTPKSPHPPAAVPVFASWPIRFKARYSVPGGWRWAVGNPNPRDPEL